MEGGLGQTIVIIMLLVAVLASAYYVTKFLAKRGRRLTQSKHIKVVDQIYLSTDKQIALIKVGTKNVLVGITNQNISLITQLDEDITAETLKHEGAGASGQNDFISKARSFFKNAWGSGEELRAAREKYKKDLKEKDEAQSSGHEDFASLYGVGKKQNERKR